MDVDLIVDAHFAARLQVRLDVVGGQLLELLAEVGQLVDVLLRLHDVARVQDAIVVEVEQAEHELRLDDGHGVPQRRVKVVDELVHVDALVFLALGEQVVQALVQEQRLVPEVLAQLQLDRVLRQVAPCLLYTSDAADE